MNDKRLYLRVTLKIMVFVSLLTLFLVLFKSFTPLFSVDTEKLKKVTIEISNIGMDEIRKSRLKGKEIAVLRRRDTNFDPLDQVDQNGLNIKTRSIKKQFFVYYNTGDSGSCPLQYASETFKDICTGKVFDTTGRESNNLQSGAVIKIPPHYFIDDRIIFGEWHGATKNGQFVPKN